MRSAISRLGLLIGFGAMLIGCSVAHSAPFTSGNIAVVRVGDGTTSLSTDAAAVSILEFTTTGTFVQKIDLPTSANRFALSGTNTLEGTLSGVFNTTYLTLAGYRATVGTSDPSLTSSGSTNRVAARVDYSTLTSDTSTRFTDAFDGVSIRSATSSTGSDFWVSGAAGTGGGMRYSSAANFGTITTTTNLGLSSNELRQTKVLDGNLFTGGGGTTPGGSVYQVGTGLPPPPATPSLSASIPSNNMKAYNSFYFTNLGSGNNWNGTGFDTVYAINTSGGTLEKWSFDGDNWVSNNSIIATGIINVTGVTAGKNVTLWVTSSANLKLLTDTSGFNANISGTFSDIATAGANFAFRGLSVVPEPASLLLCSLAGAGLCGYVARRRVKVGAAV